LSRIEVSGITIERKATSSRMKAVNKTKAKTSGARLFIRSLKSFDPAVMPLTFVSVPGTRPIVRGITSSRSRTSAAFETSSVPLPANGTLTTSTLPFGLKVEVTGDPNSC